MKWHGIWVALAAASLVGCNNLTDAEGVDIDESASNGPGESAVTPASPQINCAYPAASNWGVAAGQTVPATKSWQGYGELADTNAPAQQIDLSSLYDCDGS